MRCSRLARGTGWAVMLVLFVILWVALAALGALFVPPLAIDALLVMNVCLVAGCLPSLELISEESVRRPVVFFIQQVSLFLGILPAKRIAVLFNQSRYSLHLKLVLTVTHA